MFLLFNFSSIFPGGGQLRLRVLESFVNVDSTVVRCLALAVLRQHVAVALALGFVALVLSLILVALLTSPVQPTNQSMDQLIY